MPDGMLCIPCNPYAAYLLILFRTNLGKDKRGNLSILGVLDSRKKEDVLAFLESIPNYLKKRLIEFVQICTMVL